MTDEWMVLAGDFPTPTQADWDREVLKALNRRRPPGSELTIEQAIKRLTTTTVDGIEIAPLYLKPEDQKIGYPAQMPFTRGATLPNPAAPWIVAQLHEDPDVARTTEEIQADLNAGATGVWLRVDKDAIKPKDVTAVLSGVHPEAAPVCVSSVSEQAEAAEALLDFFGSCGSTAAKGNLGIDPIAESAVSGSEVDLSELAEWVAKAQAFQGVGALTVDVTCYDSAGAGDIDQLAFAIATGIEYVRALEAQGVAPSDGFTQIMFRVAVNADEFLAISRIRALRRLWARVGEVLEVPEDSRGAVQHAVTSWRILSKDDPWVNLLRATIGCFSASVGGADVITVLPHDAVYGLPTNFSRRIARNIQLVAAEECHLGAVKDPAGGAWVFESLTEQLAEKAWARVQEIEALGGMAQALTDGKVGEWVAATAADRAAKIATRKIPLTGVSMFPKQDEAPLTDFFARPSRPRYAGLAPCRDSQVFEVLRDRSRGFEAQTGKKPTVLLACLGERRDFGGREQFTTNLLLVGGIEFSAIEGPTPEQIVAAAHAGGTEEIVLASSAAVYAAQGVAAAKAAKDAGLSVWIAGRKTELGDETANDLIDGEIFDGMNVVTFLTETLDRLGVAK
ncbi:MAG: methylmalonyl-CoA mutase family protein [Propionibacteriaceae bacterium]|nr:methylmalonyl-CoA mutase family protein [Propionibacteriaceae bacterium]